MVAEKNMDKSLLFKLIFVACIIIAGVSVPVLQNGALGILCIMIFRADKNKMLQILAFTAPFDVVFKTSRGGFYIL